MIDLASRDEVPEELQWASGMILPALSRVYRQEEEVSDVDGEKFAQAFLDEEYGYKETAEGLEAYYNINAEAEICQMFVEYYLQNHT